MFRVLLVYGLACGEDNVISKNASAREKGCVSQAIQYLRVIVLRARAKSSFGRRRAIAAESGPVTFPRIVQGATRT